MIHLARSTAPPEYRTRYAHKIAWVLAGVMLAMALLHLVRIDKLIPIIDVALPGDAGVAMLLVCLVVTMEVFALPFLLGLRLSPLARLIGGLFSVLVPLAWTCLTIWTMGDYVTTGQFSSYVNVSANLPLLLLNYAWLGLSYWALWLLSYDASFVRHSRTRSATR